VDWPLPIGLLAVLLERDAIERPRPHDSKPLYEAICVEGRGSDGEQIRKRLGIEEEGPDLERPQRD
jgi:hypothetical protein